MKHLVIVVLATAGVAHADDRSVHGSVGGGGQLLLTGEGDGSRLRLEGEADLLPGGRFDRFGALVAIRAVDRTHHGLLCAGLVFEPAASRPRLALDLHADLGIDLDIKRPLAGAGLRTTLGIYGPLGIALDLGGYVVLHGYDTRLVIASSTSVVLRW